jgi:hypothetical protein
MTNPLPNYGLNFTDSNSSLLTQQVKIKDYEIEAKDYAAIFLAQQIEDPNYNHELSAAQLWAIKQDDTYHFLSAHPDVYNLLEEPRKIDTYKGVIIHTTGWAAPLGENGEVEGVPSKHALRRRVALAACVTSNSIGSALSFPDEEDIITDPGSATGSLAEALSKFWEDNI